MWFTVSQKTSQGVPLRQRQGLSQQLHLTGLACCFHYSITLHRRLTPTGEVMSSDVAFAIAIVIATH